MLTLTACKQWFPLLICLLLWGLPVVGLAKERYRVLAHMNDEVAEKEARPQPGAPQVLEIPPMQDAASSSAPVSPGNASRGSHVLMQDDESSRQQDLPPAETAKRSYIGLVYVSVEEEDGGVEVLDVLVGSPAAQAGFVGARTPGPTSRTDQLIKFAMAGLMMSPAAPAAVPLLIAHQMFLACHPRGDIILAVGNQAIRNAAELNDEIHRYHPGEQVEFSVVRCGKPMHVTAQMGEEELDLAEGGEESAPLREPDLSQRRDGVLFTVRPFP